MLARVRQRLHRGSSEHPPRGMSITRQKMEQNDSKAHMSSNSELGRGACVQLQYQHRMLLANVLLSQYATTKNWEQELKHRRQLSNYSLVCWSIVFLIDECGHAKYIICCPKIYDRYIISVLRGKRGTKVAPWLARESSATSSLQSKVRQRMD